MAKRRSAKQKAATRKLVAFNKRRKKPAKRRKSTPKRRRKSNKRRSKPKRRTTNRGSKKSFIDKIPILKNKTVQKIGFGLGMGVIAVNVIDLVSRFGPPGLTGPLVQNKGIIKLGVELATEPLSAVADVVLNRGVLSRVGNGGQTMTNNPGFA